MLRWQGQCAVCHGWDAGRVCKQCVERFAPTVARCRLCALPSSTLVCGACLQAPPPFDAAVAAVPYQFPWDGLIAQLKFHNALDLAPMFASLLEQAVRHNKAMPRPTLLLPMPLGSMRWRERGYNQAWEIARRVARGLRMKTSVDLLRRTADTAHQLSLPRHRRAANVRGSFALDPKHAPALRRQIVAIVDDVMTTGATAAEAACTLLEGGASSVQIWVLARTPSPQ